MNLGRRGAYGTLGIPGTGLSYRTKLSGSNRNTGSGGAAPDAPSAPSSVGLVGCFGFVTGAIAAILLLAGATGAGIGFAAFTAVLAFAARSMSRQAAGQRAQEEARLLEAARERERSLAERFGEETAGRLLAGEILTGQTAEQLREALGDPEQVDENVLKTKSREIWKYCQTGVNRFDTRITVDDGVVTTWQRKE